MTKALQLPHRMLSYTCHAFPGVGGRFQPENRNRATSADAERPTCRIFNAVPQTIPAFLIVWRLSGDALARGICASCAGQLRRYPVPCWESSATGFSVARLLGCHLGGRWNPSTQTTAQARSERGRDWHAPQPLKSLCLVCCFYPYLHICFHLHLHLYRTSVYLLCLCLSNSASAIAGQIVASLEAPFARSATGWELAGPQRPAHGAQRAPRLGDCASALDTALNLALTG